MMFRYKIFKLCTLDDSSIMGLYKDSYELESCSFGFSQGVNADVETTDYFGSKE